MKPVSTYIGRDSNMELLRILAMLGVMFVHTNFFALGSPTKFECVSSPVLSMWRFMIQSSLIISVNLFVLLSGWYGIHPKKKRLLEFFFQIFFFQILFFTIFSFIVPEKTLTRDGIGSVFMLYKAFWFIKAYLLLYIIAPVLNSYVERSTQRQFLYILLGFFLFQTFYGWLFHGVVWFEKGYSAISFIGLYLLASYLHRYGEGVRCMNKWYFLLIFIGFIIINSTLAFSLKSMGKGVFSSRLFAYNSPLVIIASTAVFFYFTKIHFSSKFINTIAISSFAAFLFHSNHFFVHEVYIRYLKEWFVSDTVIVFSIKTILFVLSLFALAIILDKIRIRIWNKAFLRYLGEKSK